MDFETVRVAQQVSPGKQWVFARAYIPLDGGTSPHSGSRVGSGTMGRGTRSPPGRVSLWRPPFSTWRGRSFTAWGCGTREDGNSVRSSRRPKIILPAVV